MAKTSNEKRTQLKQQCREALAAHIYDRLGLVIAPGQVRLQPRVEDGYAWSVTASNAFLLKSCLSSGSVRLFQAICKELGRSLEAVTPETLQNGQSRAAETPENELEGGKEEGSFTAKIRELESANHGFCSELDQTRARLDSSLDESRKLRAKNGALERELETTTSRMRHQADEMKRLREVIVQATQVLESHHPQNLVEAREDNAEAESLEGHSNLNH